MHQFSISSCASYAASITEFKAIVRERTKFSYREHSIDSFHLRKNWLLANIAGVRCTNAVVPSSFCVRALARAHAPSWWSTNAWATARHTKQVCTPASDAVLSDAPERIKMYRQGWGPVMHGEKDYTAHYEEHDTITQQLVLSWKGETIHQWHDLRREAGNFLHYWSEKKTPQTFRKMRY